MKKCRKLLGLFKEKIYITALAKGVAAGVEHEGLLKRSKSKTVIDVGANKGQFALAARNTLPLAKIYSFEPLAEPVKKFTKIFSKDSNIQLYPFALGAECSETEIHLSKRDDSSSLLPISDEQSKLFPNTEEIGVDSIQLKKLDDVLSSVDLQNPILLKIDVQGYELEVLKGGRELLKAIDTIYVECSFRELYINQPLISEVLAFLLENGFNLKGIYNQSNDLDGSTIQADFHFEAAL